MKVALRADYPVRIGLISAERGLDREYHVRQVVLGLGLTSDASESSNHLVSNRR